MFIINFTFNIIGLYLLFINYKELSVDWIDLFSICNFADRYFLWYFLYNHICKIFN